MPVYTEINDINIPQLDIFTKYSEPQLLTLYEPGEGLFIAESPNVISRALDAGYRPVSFLVERRQLSETMNEILARCHGVPVYTADYDVLSKIKGYGMTRGVLCAMRRRPLPPAEDLCRNAGRIAVLENIVNPTNLGAIIRSAAALDIDAVLLTPSCTDPLYRRAARVSMGTVFQVPWSWIGNAPGTTWPGSGTAFLKSMGFLTAAMALRGNTININDPSLVRAEKLAIFLGSEGDGLMDETISLCDYTVKIPMSHGVDSLNVAAAGAVAFWVLGKH